MRGSRQFFQGGGVGINLFPTSIQRDRIPTTEIFMEILRQINPSITAHGYT